MKTIEEIKLEILTTNPSRKYILNGEEFEQNDIEFAEAIETKAQLIYEAEKIEAETAAKRAATLAKLEALGLNEDDLKIALGF